MKYITRIIICLLVVIILLQRLGCTNGGSGKPASTDTVIVVDTVWKKHDSLVYKKVQVIKIIHDTLPPEYIPDPMYDSLKVQYEELAKDYLAKRIYADTLKIPQLKGLFVVNDTVKNNSVIGRSWSADYIIPVITKTKTITVTEQAPQKRQVYIGGGLAVNKSVNGSAQLGMLYKDRKDRISGVYIGFDPSGQMIYGLQSYWKISFKK